MSISELKMTIKKTIISGSSLPPLSSNGEYVLRYRIVSEDKNRTSHWSPIYYIDAKPSIRQVTGGIEISNGTLVVSVIWGDPNLKSIYDIFVSFGIFDEETSELTWGDYFYHGSSTNNSYSFLRNPEHTDVRVKIQLAGIEKERNPILTICTLQGSKSPRQLQPDPPTSVVLANNGSTNSLNASWIAPAYLGPSTPEMYNISLYNGSGVLITENYANVRYPQTSTKIEGLSQNTQYSIRVSLTNLEELTSSLSDLSQVATTSSPFIPPFFPYFPFFPPSFPIQTLAAPALSLAGSGNAANNQYYQVINLTNWEDGISYSPGYTSFEGNYPEYIIEGPEGSTSLTVTASRSGYNSNSSTIYFTLGPSAPPVDPCPWEYLAPFEYAEFCRGNDLYVESGYSEIRNCNGTPETRDIVTRVDNIIYGYCEPTPPFFPPDFPPNFGCSSNVDSFIFPCSTCSEGCGYGPTACLYNECGQFLGCDC
jgi:hypothetical protein